MFINPIFSVPLGTIALLHPASPYVYQPDVFCAVRHYRFVALVCVLALAPLGATPGRLKATSLAV
jgi:hypothetical protein